MMKLAPVALTTACTLATAGWTLPSGLPSDVLAERQGGQGYVDPTTAGGSMLTRLSANTQMGEPLNVIISGDSDKEVLTPQGASEYLESLYFSPGTCLGISAGGPQQANLGDGNGYRDQTDVLRFNYYQGDGGSCLESIHGGNHLRYFMQNGSAADSGAIFIAASVEYPASQSHNLVPDGYDLGRDLFVGNATNSSGTTSPGGYHYTTTSTQVPLLQSVNTANINHGISVDGQVAVLTVHITKKGTMGANRLNNGTSESSGSAATVRMLRFADLVTQPMTLRLPLLVLLLTSGMLVFV